MDQPFDYNKKAEVKAMPLDKSYRIILDVLLFYGGIERIQLDFGDRDDLSKALERLQEEI